MPGDSGCNKCGKGALACICPPCAVLAERGCGCCMLNVLLTILGIVPGIIHACCIVCADNSDYPPQPTTVVVHTTQPGV